MRLDKLVAEQTGSTRSAVKGLIQSGRVTVNGLVVKDGAKKVSEEEDEVALDGEVFRFQRFAYFMLNKPAGVVSATRDKADATVVALLDASDRKKRKLFPVGRLDKDTEGLLLITDDGMLSHQLLSPRKHADKLYFARLTRDITKEEVALFASGMKVDEELTAMPAELRKLTEEERAVFFPGEDFAAAVTLCEGKFHQVKRMFAATGNEVLYLKRIAMGGVTLEPKLLPGQYRELSKEELDCLRMSVEHNSEDS